jgi:uncharacterized protein YdeI (YjbR/CyaY-like superfamily)
MGAFDELPEYFAKDLKDWRRWLKRHHASSPGVWLIFYQKGSDVQGVDYVEAVEEALCWGWIDSLRQKIDDTRYRQTFCPRKPKSIWSAVNKTRIERLIAVGRMQPAGLAKIEAAKADGSWATYDAVENHEIPADLQAAFDARPALALAYRDLSPSKRKMILSWLATAKREATRQERIRRMRDSLIAGKLPFS